MNRHPAMFGCRQPPHVPVVGGGHVPDHDRSGEDLEGPIFLLVFMHFGQVDAAQAADPAQALELRLLDAHLLPERLVSSLGRNTNCHKRLEIRVSTDSL